MAAAQGRGGRRVLSPASAAAARLSPAVAAAALAAGALVACATEGPWGLTCRPDHEGALAALLHAKRRDAGKGLILVAASRAQLAPWLAPLEPAWRSRMDLAWPGPVTFVAPAARGLPALLTGGRSTLAVRVTAHPTLLALIDACDSPLVSTSANASGAPTLRTATAIRRTFGDALAGIVAGEPGGRRKPSDIVDVRTGARLR